MDERTVSCPPLSLRGFPITIYYSGPRCCRGFSSTLPVSLGHSLRPGTPLRLPFVGGSLLRQHSAQRRRRVTFRGTAVNMVKSGGRSKGGKGKVGKGGHNDGSGSGPPSPTRRLKKGGKRGRRLCHRDGCSLCPSFGFEGEVAVSCSHHKEPGMRNLTARRCQHDGCFTVANFGLPGEKPGFCAAHSSTGMVNRNKPRGAEGVLAGVPIPRSSRRAAKANTAVHSASDAARARAAAACEVTTRSSCRTSYAASSCGTESSSGRGSAAGDAGDGAKGDENAAARMFARVRCNGRGLDPYKREFGDKVVDDGATGSHRGKNGGKLKGKTGGRGGVGPAASPGMSSTFISRGEDPPESPVAVHYASHKRPDTTKAAGGAGRVRARGGAAAAVVTASAQLLHRPAAAAQEAFLAAARSGMKAAQRGHPEGVVFGGGAHRGLRAGMEGSFTTDSRGRGMADGVKDALGGFTMDVTVRDPVLDGPSTSDPHNGLEELLGTRDSPEAERHADRMVTGSRGMLTSDVRYSSTVRFPGGLSLVASAGGAAAPSDSSGSMDRHAGEALSGCGDGGEDFNLDLQGLSGLDLTNLNSVAAVAGIGREARQAPHQPPASRRASAPMGLQLGGVPAVVLSPPQPSRRASSGGLASSSTPTSTSHAAMSSISTPLRDNSISVPTPPPAPGGLPGDEAWWDVLEREEFVAMPEPIWGVNLGNQGLDDEPRRQEDPRAWRAGGTGAGGGGGLQRSAARGTISSPGPLAAGVVAEGREATLESIVLDEGRVPSLMSSSPSLGVGMGMGEDDERYIEGKIRGGSAGRGSGGSDTTSHDFNPLLSGVCRPGAGDRDDMLVGGGVRLSPVKKKPRLSIDGERECVSGWLVGVVSMAHLWYSVMYCTVLLQDLDLPPLILVLSTLSLCRTVFFAVARA